MKRLVSTAHFVGMFLAVIGIVTQFQSSLWAQQNACSLATLQGAYIWGNNGLTIEVDQSQKTWAYAGKEEPDGVGNLTGMYSGSYDGEIVRGVTYIGTYTVNADCTGSLIRIDQSGNSSGIQANYDIFVDSSTGDYYFTATDEGEVTQGFNQKVK